MIIDIDDPLRNVILNACFYGIVAVSLLSIIPWRLANKANRWTRYLPLIGLMFYLVYESAMPASWDIRIDLLLLAPFACLILISGMVRFFLARRRQRNDDVHP